MKKIEIEHEGAEPVSVQEVLFNAALLRLANAPDDDINAAADSFTKVIIDMVKDARGKEKK